MFQPPATNVEKQCRVIRWLTEGHLWYAEGDADDHPFVARWLNDILLVAGINESGAPTLAAYGSHELARWYDRAAAEVFRRYPEHADYDPFEEPGVGPDFGPWGDAFHETAPEGLPLE